MFTEFPKLVVCLCGGLLFPTDLSDMSLAKISEAPLQITKQPSP